MTVSTWRTHAEMCRGVAAEVIDAVQRKPDCLLCIAAGDTPVAVFREVVHMARTKSTDFSRARFVGLDEWVGVPRSDRRSCAAVVHREFFAPLRFAPDRVCFFDGIGDADMECQRTARFLAEYGPVDLMILGLGINGHLGLNEPGSDFQSQTRCVPVSDSTRVVAAKYGFGGDAPAHGMTIGIADIMDSRNLHIIASGQSKAEIIRSVIEDRISVEVPATAVRRHPNAVLNVDLKAAGLVKPPVRDEEWTTADVDKDASAGASGDGALSTVLRSRIAALRGKRVMVGFDGFVDEVYRVVKEKHGRTAPTHFARLNELGSYITDRGGASLSLELESLATKIGGNAPILGNALSCLGVTTDIVAPVGHPTRIEHFADSQTVTYHSYGMPGKSIALEFDDAKMLLADMAVINAAAWHDIVDRVGTDVLNPVVRAADAVALVNWGELDHASSMWAGFLDDFLVDAAPHDRIVLFDLSDSSRRSDAEHQEVVDLIRAYANYGRTIVSVNRHEASLLSRSIGAHPEASPQELTRTLGTALSLDWAVIHGSYAAVAWARGQSPQAATDTSPSDHGTTVWVPTVRVPSPRLTTGGGDNFNAGLLLGCLLGLDVQDALTMGNAVATCYVRDGRSPCAQDLVDLLEDTCAGHADAPVVEERA